jgi:phosphomannomutase/phosphoglucomutase
MKEENAALAGEMSGHTFFKERWYGFDDGIYAGVRLLEILSRFDDPSKVLNNLPNSISTPELQIKMKEGEPHALIKKLQTEAKFDNALEIIKVDGLRVEYQDGFGLMRASNTTPVIVLRFEAENKNALERIQNSFRNVLTIASPESHLPF